MLYLCSPYIPSWRDRDPHLENAFSEIPGYVTDGFRSRVTVSSRSRNVKKQILGRSNRNVQMASFHWTNTISHDDTEKGEA